MQKKELWSTLWLLIIFPFIGILIVFCPGMANNKTDFMNPKNGKPFRQKDNIVTPKWYMI